jgi:hypothetical protein
LPKPGNRKKQGFTFLEIEREGLKSRRARPADHLRILMKSIRSPGPRFSSVNLANHRGVRPGNGRLIAVF